LKTVAVLLRYEIVPPLPVILWSDGIRRCVLRPGDGPVELLLYYEGQVVRLEKCADESAARLKAYEWLLMVPKLAAH
jgi:hypothetical protein